MQGRKEHLHLTNKIKKIKNKTQNTNTKTKTKKKQKKTQQTLKQNKLTQFGA